MVGKVDYSSEGEYKYFIAIKTGLLSDQFHLEPLSSWEASQNFEIVEQKKYKKLLYDVYDFLSGIC